MLSSLLSQLKFASDSCSTGIFGNNTPGLYDHLCNGTQVNITALTDIAVVIANIIRILFAVSGALGVIFIIVAGIFYVTSAGNPAQLKRAREIITNVVIGLVIMLVAYAAVTFIAEKIS